MNEIELILWLLVSSVVFLYTWVCVYYIKRFRFGAATIFALIDLFLIMGVIVTWSNK